MAPLSASEGRRLLDAVHELGTVDSLADLPIAVARLTYGLIPCDRAGWVVINFATGSLDGVHWPDSTVHLLKRLPQDLSTVPLVPEISRRINTDPLRISDVWSRREWHSKPIYADLYRPNGGEFQLVLPLSFANSASAGAEGRRMESLTLMRWDSDFTDHENELLAEFGRHIRNSARHLRRHATIPTIENAARLGLTARQGEVLVAVSDGSSVKHAAHRLGLATKTVENHLQAAYAILGVSNRTAALARLSVGPSGGFGLGEIPH